MNGRRRGSSLLELVIVLALLALLAGVAVMPLDAMHHPVPRTISDDAVDSLRVAARTGVSRLVAPSDSLSAFVLEDGRIFADSAFRIDPLSGRVAHAR